MFCILFLTFLSSITTPFLRYAQGQGLSTSEGWASIYGGVGGDWSHSIQQTRDGGYIVAGTTSSFGAGNDDFWVLKLRPDGTLEWQKTHGGKSADVAVSVQQTGDDGYIAVAGTFSFGAGKDDIWVLKLCPDGTIEWQKTYGGYSYEGAHSIQQTRDGGYIVAGYSESFPAIGKGTDLWVLKLGPDGTVEWQKTYGGILVFPSRNYSVLQACDGGYVVAGATDSFGVVLEDAWVLKLSTDGMVKWQKTYGRRYSYERANSVYETSDGGYIVAGNTFSFLALDAGSDLLVLKLSPDGSINCPHNLEIGDAIGSEVETYATVSETHALIWDSNVSPQDATAITRVTNVSPQTLWP